MYASEGGILFFLIHKVHSPAHRKTRNLLQIIFHYMRRLGIFNSLAAEHLMLGNFTDLDNKVKRSLENREFRFIR